MWCTKTGKDTFGLRHWRQFLCAIIRWWWMQQQLWLRLLIDEPCVRLVYLDFKKRDHYFGKASEIMLAFPIL